MSLAGLLLDDPGCREVEDLRNRAPVALVSAGPGRGPEAAFAALKEEALHRGSRVLRLARALTDPESWMTDLANAVTGALELEETENNTLQGLLLQNSEHLQVPSTIVIPVGNLLASSVLPELLSVLDRAALVTRDLTGPLSFLVILNGVSTPAGSNDPFVWRALHGSPRVISPSLKTEFTSAVFEAYFALRVFWAAAGQPQWIDEFSDSMPGPGEYETSGDPDRRLDTDLDRLLVGKVPPAREYVEALRWALPDPAARRAFLRRGALTTGDAGGRRLASAGITWSPPGSLKEPVTLAAALRFSEEGTLAPKDGVGPTELVALRSAARRNYLIGSWVLSLAAQIESELVEALRSGCNWRQVFDNRDWAASLEKEREEHPIGIAAETPADILEFATFYQLQVAATVTGCATRIGLSIDSVDMVRRVRNLAAHQHVVTWSGVRAVADAIKKVINRKR